MATADVLNFTGSTVVMRVRHGLNSKMTLLSVYKIWLIYIYVSASFQYSCSRHLGFV